ncbi:DUF4349 domain-containing protein [Sediminibacillus albus]|uniref:DUF4349 domain-containing protein n=1 Tax=Sediminibacillus albus TaxID=407036 RepID=A0A1G9AQJ3_9BACI|nr:DUF4349 domain-containing protein [Sediminibacillus albus]SDK29636.1 protein of unknown function [Sediminibacillus albus]
MKKWFLILLVLGFSVYLAGCSNDSELKESTEIAGDTASETAEYENSETGEESQGTADGAKLNKQESKESAVTSEAAQTNRKVIYNANLRVEVKDYQQSFSDFQAQVSEAGGYIVESNTHEGSDEDFTQGHITARIPQKHFQSFIDFVEEGSSKVLENSITGQDVTEEYVDLQSRLKTKQAVEERLLAFMEEAKKTEDLLKISNDLASIQEEIETITGRIRYLDNKVDLATVTIHLQEYNVKISGVDNDNLNTWDKTKEQFMKSINVLLSAFSGLFVFLIGNLPILILLAVIGTIAFFIIKKARQRNEKQ